MRKRNGDENDIQTSGSGYSILFVSNRTERVKTIRLTTGKLILVVMITAALITGVLYSLIHGAIVRKTYEDRIKVLTEQINEPEENK